MSSTIPIITDEENLYRSNYDDDMMEEDLYREDDNMMQEDPYREDYVDDMMEEDLDEEYRPIVTCRAPVQPHTTYLKFPPSLQVELMVTRNKKESARRRKEALQVVERWLVEQGTCAVLSPTIVDDFLERMFDFNPNEMQSYLRTGNTLNAYIHDNLSCLVNGIYSRQEPRSALEARIRERIKYWLPYVKLIGAESVYGYAFQTSFNSYATQLFVIKVPRDSARDDLIHEATIGLYVTNKMRHEVPNFMYVYGYTKCSPVVLDGRDVLTWCTAKEPSVSYLITENIPDAQSFGQFIQDQTLDFEDFKAVFLQIPNALNRAFKKYKYVHNDLHHDNILVRRFARPIAVPYYGTGETILGYIVTRFVPFIIDYGLSSAQIGSDHFGPLGYARSGIILGRPFPMYDTYKLLGFLSQMLEGSDNSATFQGLLIGNFLASAFLIFNDGTIYARTLRRVMQPDADHYEAPDFLRNMTHDDYLTELMVRVPELANLIIPLGNIDTTLVHIPNYDGAIDSCDFYRQFNLHLGPVKALEYCQAVSALQADTTLTEGYFNRAMDWLNTRFDAELYLNSVSDDILDDIRNIDIMMIFLQNNNAFTKPAPTEIEATDYAYITEVRRTLTTLLRLRERVANLISTIRAISCALSNQNKYQQHSLQLQQWTNKIEEPLNLLKNAREAIRSWSSQVAALTLVTNQKSITHFWSVEYPNFSKQVLLGTEEELVDG